MKTSPITPFGHETYADQPAKNIVIPVTQFLHKLECLSDTEKQGQLWQLDDTTIIDLLEHIEIIDKSLRSSLSVDLFDDVRHLGDLQRLWSDVEIFHHNIAEFVVCLPPVVSCSYRYGEYGLANRVRLELREWYSSQQKPPYRVDDPLIFAYKRYISKITRQVCDNDNMELRRVTNAIVSVIGGSDKATTVFSSILHTLPM